MSGREKEGGGRDHHCHKKRLRTQTHIWTLMKYEVVDIQVISPDDVDAIKIQEGRDLVTLLTCHPPNTGGRQRLLVFSEKVIE